MTETAAPTFNVVRDVIGEHLFVHRGKCMCGERLGAERGPVDPARLADHMATAITNVLEAHSILAQFPVVLDPTMPVGELRLVNRQPMSEADIPPLIMAAIQEPVFNQQWGLKALRFAHHVIQFTDAQSVATAVAGLRWHEDWVVMHRTPDPACEGGQGPWYEICGAYRSHPRMLNSVALWGIGCTKQNDHIGMHLAGL